MTRYTTLILIALAAAVAVGLAVPWIAGKLAVVWSSILSDMMGGM